MWPVAGSQPERSANWSIETIYLLLPRRRGGGGDFFYYTLVYYGNSSSRLNVCSFSAAAPEKAEGSRCKRFHSISGAPIVLCRPARGHRSLKPSLLRSFAPSNSCAAHKLSDFPLALISIDGPLSIAKLLSQNLNHNQSRSQSFARKLRARPETERERKEKAEKAKLFNDVKYKVFCLVAGASNLSKL